MRIREIAIRMASCSDSERVQIPSRSIERRVDDGIRVVKRLDDRLVERLERLCHGED